LPSERRVAARQEVSRIGQISSEQLVEAVDCMVHDLSSSGALLVLKGTGSIPNAFRLRIAGAGRTFQCVVKRRKEQMLGVQFER